jgi:hypothetical protein
MSRIRIAWLFFIIAAWHGDVRGGALLDGFEIRPGGRFENQFRVEEGWSPYQWNFNGDDPVNRTRLMLDLNLSASRRGALYVKGDASWMASRTSDGEKLFAFRQGDYSYAWQGSASSAAIRLFANERRFFTGAYLAPLLTDDHADDTGANRGVRLDFMLRETVQISSVFASLDDDWDDARKISFIKSAYLNRMLQFSVTYLYEVPGLDAAPRQALLKNELVCFYNKATLLFSYEQSRFKKSGLFVPRLSFRTDGFVGDNFSTILPDEGAFFAQVRITPLSLRDWGEVTIVHDYFAVGEDFINDLGIRSGEKVGYLFGTFFRAKEVDVNGRLQYGRSVRSKREADTRERFDASIWGALRGGVEVALRGGYEKTSDAFAVDSRQNHVLGAVTFHARKMRHGFHLLARDLDTAGSSGSLAWDSRVVLNSDFAVNWRFILSSEHAVRDPVFCRLEFRPSRRLYAYVGYGRDYMGNSPFLLDDDDLSLIEVDPSMYTISLRGDF